MSQVIYKYPLEIEDVQTLRLHANCKPLCTQVLDGDIYMWCKVNIDLPVKEYQVHMYGTGHIYEEIKDDYVGTVQLHNGKLVYHIFIED